MSVSEIAVFAAKAFSAVVAFMFVTDVVCWFNKRVRRTFWPVAAPRWYDTTVYVFWAALVLLAWKSLGIQFFQ